MIIGIDASFYRQEKSTGIESYSYQLLNNLIPLLGRDHHNQIILYGREDFVTTETLPFNVEKRILPFKHFWTMLRLSWEMLIKPVNVLFVPSHQLPLFSPQKAIVTIHDLAFRHLETGNFLERFILHLQTHYAIRKAYRIIVPSEAVQKDLLKFYNYPESKIVIIPYGAPEISKFRQWSFAQEQKLRSHFHITENDLYILYVGPLETKKNLVRLVQAFHEFSGNFPDWKLILAGERGFGFGKIWKAVRDFGLEEKIFMPGNITEEEKVFLLENCRIFAFPSLDEGFGFPVLEAFAYEKPVLTSDCSSFPEVAGKAALLVDPKSVPDLTAGLTKLADNPVFSLQLGKKGPYQLWKFSWATSSEKVWEFLQS